MARTRLAAIALALALGAAGCGGDGDDADQFREDYNAAVDRLNDVNTNIQESGQSIASQSGEEIAQDFNRIADTAEKTRQELEDLDPPEDAQEEFDRLVSSVEEGVQALRATAEAAREENQQRFLEAAQRLSQTGEKITEAENALKSAVDG
jgi:predicted DsbA family dithiol-disulfide isomerase